MRPLVLCAVLLAGCGKGPAVTPTHWYTMEEGEALARQTHRPALIYFHAQWDSSAKELERETLVAPEVINAMSSLIAIDYDYTDETDEQCRVVNRFASISSASVVLVDDFDRYREWTKPIPEERFRVQQFMEPEPFAAKLRAALRMH